MSTTTITMPQLGETVTEGTITRWLKKVGDNIEKYEAFAEVATDKVNAEIPSPTAGVLLEILVKEGETVPTGAAIASIGVKAGSTATMAGSGGTAGGSAVAGNGAGAGNGAAAGASSNGTTPAAAAPANPAAATIGSGSAVSRATASTAAPGTAAAASDFHGRRLSPAVRRALREFHVDPATLKGTGHDGRITLEDVGRAARDGSTAPVKRIAGTQRIPLTRARKTIAEHMVHASQTIPHAWTMIEVDVTNLVAKRHADRERFKAETGTVPTYSHYFSYAVVQALTAHPMMNARFCDDAIEMYGNVDLSFAVALNGTLVVPVVHGAEKMSFAELSRAMSSVTERARGGRLSIDELRGGTITVNNTGANGSVLSKPIINGGQAAIVTMEAIVKRPVVIDGDAIAIRSMVNVCCTIDHRVVDGDVVGAFLRDLKIHLTNP